MRKKKIAILTTLIMLEIFFINNVYAASNYTLEINYVDYADGQKIAPTVVKSIPAGATYEAEKKEIKDYTFFSSDGESSGIMPNAKKTITYKYKYNNCKITIQYLNDNTDEILKEKTEIGTEGDKCTFKPEEFKGVKLFYEPGNIESTFTKKDKIVTFHYQNIGKINVTYIDKFTSKVIKRKSFSDLVDAYADIYSERINDYEYEDIGKAYYYKEDEQNIDVYLIHNGTVAIKYLDKDDNRSLNSFWVKVRDGDTYTAKAEEFEGYKLVEKPEEEVVKMQGEDKTLIYFYERIKPDFFPITNFRNMSINGYYHEFTKSGNNKLELTSSELQNSKGAKIESDVSIKNVGEVEGSCNLVVKIPDGYEALEEDNPDFTISDDKKEAYINDVTVAPQEYSKDYKLILTKKDVDEPSGTIYLETETKSNIGDSNTNNDKSTIELTILPKTGKITFIGNVLLGIALILFFAYIINSVRKKNQKQV